MAIKLIANYSKRLGLPGYSSHQFCVSAETELIDLGEVQKESTRLYELLQDAVDREIQHTGFVPDEAYGQQALRIVNGSSSSNGAWKCSDKQRDLILKIVDENGLDRGEVDDLAHQRFGKGVKELSKIEASGLIDELLESNTRQNGSKASPSKRRRQNAYAGGGR